MITLKKWNASAEETAKNIENKLIEKETIKLLEMSKDERMKKLNSFDEDKKKIKEKIQEILKIQDDERIEKISKELLKQDEIIRNKKISEMDKKDRDKVNLKIKEIQENKKFKKR